MKLKYLLPLLFLFILSACEDVEKINKEDLFSNEELALIEAEKLGIPVSQLNEENNPNISKPQFPVTATINGEQANLFNNFGDDKARDHSTQEKEFIRFVAADGFGFNFKYSLEIVIAREDIKVGKYSFDTKSERRSKTFMHIVDSSNDFISSPIEGYIEITNSDITTKTIKGVFEFTASSIDEPLIKTHKITNGKFQLTYEELDN